MNQSGSGPAPVALGQPSLGSDELAAVAEVFGSGWLAGQGPTGKLFEQEFATSAGTAHALPVSNCTAALHLATHALGLGPGDEVVVADYTFPATAHAVLYSGARPVFADVRPDLWTLDPAAAAAAITPRTVGIIAVDTVGQCADYGELEQLAARHGLWLVEDAACASGATYQGRPAGSFGDAACFSFHGRKGISSGEGGALTTDRSDLAARARSLHNFGIESALTRQDAATVPVPVFGELGWNYKLSDIAAAIMRVQLRRQPELLAARARAASGYAELLAGSDLVTLPVTAPDRTHTWQSYLLTLDPVVDRARAMATLRRLGVQCTFGTYALHRQPVYGDQPVCEVSAALFERQVAIPMHSGLSDADVERVAAAVHAAVVDAA